MPAFFHPEFWALDNAELWVGVGNIFGQFLAGALRNPSAAGSPIGNLFVGAALAEALGILSFVLGILLYSA